MDLKALKQEANRSSTSSERLLELAQLDPQLSRLIAKRTDTPLELRCQLCKSRDMPTRAAVAKNRTTPLELLEELARDPQWTVAKAVLGARVNRTVTLSRTIFEIIAGHKRFSVRQTAAESFFCPPDLLERLSRDPEAEVRRAVADNPKATPEILDALADDSDDMVVWRVTRHVNTTNPTLDKLTQHPNIFTRLGSIDPYVFHFNSRTRSIPVDRLVKLSQDPDPEVLSAILYNNHTPTWLVEQIFSERPEVFEVDTGLFLREVAVYGSSSARGLERAVGDHLDLDVRWLERMATIHNTNLSYRILKHPNTTAQILDSLARMYLAYLEQHRSIKADLDQPQRALLKANLKHAKLFLADLTEHPLLSPEAQGWLIEGFKQTILLFHSLHQLRKSPHDRVQQALPEILDAMVSNHLEQLESNIEDVSTIRYFLAELTLLEPISLATQKRILGFLAAQPLDSSEVYQLDKSPHPAVQDFLKTTATETA